MKRIAYLDNLTPRTFLTRYWQKSPHLIRQAFPGFIPPISADELAGLACEPGVESRLITRTRKKTAWSVRQGPFKKSDFKAQPKKYWTLLVHDTDKHHPDLADFLHYFDFIPNWRIDDLMISYAADGGSVGPHVDAYDVFLLQAKGQRRWSITQKSAVPAHGRNIELEQVHTFKPQHTWLLEAGDMLYLPPGVAHHGIAVGECMTFSIGFRAPAETEMLADLNHKLLMRLDKKTRYTDPDIHTSDADPGLISKKVRTDIRNRVRNAQRLNDSEIDEWFGCFITEPKPWLTPSPARRNVTVSELRSRLAKRKMLRRDPAIILVWYREEPSSIKLFANGHCYVLPVRLSGLTRVLCKHRTYGQQTLATWLADGQAVSLLAELYNSGIVYFS
jgi:50S ribosomal protein L16 3-hydroxylase